MENDYLTGLTIAGGLALVTNLIEYSIAKENLKRYKNENNQDPVRFMRAQHRRGLAINPILYAINIPAREFAIYRFRQAENRQNHIPT